MLEKKHLLLPDKSHFPGWDFSRAVALEFPAGSHVVGGDWKRPFDVFQSCLGNVGTKPAEGDLWEMSFLWEEIRNRMEFSTENGLLKSHGRGMG